MKRWALIVCAVLSFSLSACAGGGAAGGIATLDPAATKACQGLQQVMQNRAALSSDQLREQLGNVYDQAQASTNAIIQTRAVALYADATVMASGGDPGSLDADLNSMQKACSGGTGS